MKIRYLEAMYGLGPDQSHVAVPVDAEKKLERMARDLVGTEDLVAIYVPLATPEIYDPKSVLRGKVVGAVKLLPMPEGHTTRDYFFDDLADGKRRWPFGYPCDVVLYPRAERRFDLKPLIELVHGSGQFATYAKMFQSGPVEVRPDLGDRLLTRLRDACRD
jgi:hypothetical protein